jgi:hypothetical protein
VIVSDVSHLKPQSNKKVECICDDCIQPFVRQFQLVNRQMTHRCKQCARRNVHRTMNTERIAIANVQRSGHKHPRWNPNKRDFQAFANRVRWLTEKNYRVFKHLINPNGVKRTRCGVSGGYQLDHIISLQRAFESGMCPEKCASVENLQILPWKVNRTKHAGAI